jgi:hypothetical protein
MRQILCALISVALLSQPSLALIQDPAQSEPVKEQPVEQVAMEELLPADTIAFVATTNLSGLLASFRRLEAFKVMEARLPEAERRGAGSPLAEAVRFLSFGIKDSSVLDETRLGFALFKPGEQALALPDDGARRNPGAKKPAPPPVPANPSLAAVEPGIERPLQMPEPHFVAFVEADNLNHARKAREQFINYFSDTFSDLGKPEEAKQIKYRGSTIERFKNGYVGAMIGATYVIGDLGAVDSILTLRERGDAPRLSDDQAFARARLQFSAPTGLFAYLNGQPLATLLADALRSIDVYTPQMLKLFNPEAIKSAALSSTFEREGVVDRLVINLDPAKKNLLSTLFAGPAVEFRAGQFVPSGTQILVNESIDFPRLYDDLFVPLFFNSLAQAEIIRKAELERKNQGQQVPPAQRRREMPVNAEELEKATKEIIARYEKEIGFKFREELAKDLGHEVTVAIGIPKPNRPATESGENTGTAALIALRDREATRAALTKLIVYLMSSMGRSALAQGSEPPPEDQPKSEEQLRREQEQRAALIAAMPREIYKRAEILPLFVLAIGFFDDYLVLADSAETIKQLVDTPELGTPITLDQNFRQAMVGQPSAVTTQVFIGPKYFDDLLGTFLKAWVARMPEDDASHSVSVPATLAAFIEGHERAIRLEAFSPIGIPAMIATSMVSDRVRAQATNNEMQTLAALRRVVAAEKNYAAKHEGRYATLDELAKTKPADFDFARLKAEGQAYRYELKLKSNAAGYELTATPVRYGRQGRLSFFVDESGRIRRADKKGEPATAKDEMSRENDDKE